MTNVIVTPNRFWPEMTGGSGGGDRAFLHAHSAMLTRILNAKDSLIKAISAKSKDKTIILDENMNQQIEVWKEYTATEVISCWLEL